MRTSFAFTFRPLLHLILCLGIYLRLECVIGGHWPYYTHDRDDHAEYVRYVHMTGRVPPPELSLEFGQQPIYYLLVSPLYHSNWDWRANDTMLAIAGLCIDLVGLCIAFCSLTYIPSAVGRFAFFTYIALTPSFVLAAPCIGNDVMVRTAGLYVFFCTLRLNRSPLNPSAYGLLIFAVLLALSSKINALCLVPIIPWALLRTWQACAPVARLRLLTQRLLVPALGLALWLSLTLIHANIGRSHFTLNLLTHMKNDPTQFIPDTGWNYLFSFHLTDLIHSAEASTWRSPAGVRFSYPTFVYGNMLLGEQVFAHPLALAQATTPLFITGLLLPISGLLFFASTLYRMIRAIPNNLVRQLGSISTLSLVIVPLAVAAVYSFIVQRPICCHADFRMLYPALPWFGLAIARGLATTPRLVQILLFLPIAAYAISAIWLLHQTYQYGYTE